MKNFCLIIGMGDSGQWAYNLTMRLGYVPIVFDDEFLTVEEVEPLLDEILFAVISPGVPSSHKIVERLNKKGVKIIAEVELAFRAFSQKGCLVGVTGTNGKTTVVSMLNSILGESVTIAGNIGVPWSKVVNADSKSTVLELSSFQLNYISSFKPNIAVFTNLAPDHIDYHGNYQNYKDAKMNLINNATAETIIIYNGEDEDLSFEVEKRGVGRFYYFRLNESSGNGAFLRNGNVIIKDDDGFHELFSIKNLNFAYHNKLNLLCASLVSYIMGVVPQDILSGIKTFKFPRFRQEVVENLLGLTIINDSKSTNLASTLSALKGRSDDVTLIVGGRGKSEEYSKLFSKEFNIAKIVAYGEAGLEFKECARLNNYKNIEYIENFDEAVRYTLLGASKNGTILFSPACSSFDQFSSYVERGERFNKIIREYENLNS